jgi:hypothetical protein
MTETGARRAALRLMVPALAAAALTGCLRPEKSAGGAAAPAAVAATAGPEAAGPAPAGRAVDMARLPPGDDNPERLMGLDAAALRAMLGAPRFLRRDNPAQLWRYAAAGCVLELYLYRSGPGGEYVVRHLAARPVPADGAAVSERSCLGALLRAHRAGAAG